MIWLTLCALISSASAWELSSDVDRMTDVESHYASVTSADGALLLLSCTTERKVPIATIAITSGGVIDSERVGSGRVVPVRYRGAAAVGRAPGLFVAQSLTVAIDGDGALLSLIMASPSTSALLEVPIYRRGSVVYEVDTSGVSGAISALVDKCAGKVTP